MSHPDPHSFNQARRLGFREALSLLSHGFPLGVPLGSADDCEFDLHLPPKHIRKGFEIVRTLGTEASLLEEFNDDEPTARGISPLLSVSRHDGTHLVLVRTGLSGPADDHLCQILSEARFGRAPQPHGSTAISGGSRVISLKETGELPITIGSVERRRFSWRKRRAPERSAVIPARVATLWELSPDAELLVQDIFPGREFRIVIRNGRVEIADAQAQRLAA